MKQQKKPLDEERDRAIRLFTYLKEISNIKTKVKKDVSEYDKVIWFHDVPENKTCHSVLNTSDGGNSQDPIWLEIKRTDSPKKPLYPSICQKWIEASEDGGPADQPHLKQKIEVEIPPQYVHPGSPSYKVEYLVEHPEISREWQKYLQNSWAQWEDTYKLWQKADNLYFDLFSIHQQLKKLGEQYELIIGIGLLSWNTTSNQTIRRHIITGDVQLTFDADHAKFFIQAPAEGVKLHFETEMVDANSLPTLNEQKILDNLLEENSESPWDTEQIGKVLRSWIHLVNSKGQFSGSLVPPVKNLNEPVVTFAPALILRQRTQRSQIECFNQIIEQLTNGADIPLGIKKIIETPRNDVEDTDDNGEINNIINDGIAYLPLPANEEQIQIVQRVEISQGILVQGPPGTGKSHTIANLICHLLAQGKKVLVTSQTPRALKVLKEKIPPEISALCVVLLGNDPASRKELEDSTQGINQKYSEWDPAESRNLIKSLETELYKTRKALAEKNYLLGEQREIETRVHQVSSGQYNGTAQNLAIRINNEKDNLGWIPDNVTDSRQCPLSNVEFFELLKLYRQLSEEYCLELHKLVVNRDGLPDINTFIQLVANENTNKTAFEKYKEFSSSKRFQILKEQPNESIKGLYESLSDLLIAIENTENKYPWSPTAAKDILNYNSAPWKELSTFMKKNLAGVNEKAKIVQMLNVQFSSLDTEKLKTDALNRLDYFQKGGKKGWLIFENSAIKQTKYIEKQVVINGRPCNTPEALKLLATYFAVHETVELLWNAWKGKDIREEGSLILQLGYLDDRSKQLDEILSIEKFLIAIKQYFAPIKGIANLQLSNKNLINEVLLDLKAVLLYQGYTAAKHDIDIFVERVRATSVKTKSHPLNNQIITAIEERDVDKYSKGLDSLDTLETSRMLLRKRDILEQKLNKVAPGTCSLLTNSFTNIVWDKRAECFEESWSWKQADSWLNRFNKDHDEAKLENEIENLTRKDHDIIAKLAASKAWDSCLSHLTESQRTNLLAWAHTMKKIPKTLSAKTRPGLLRQAQDYMDACKGAIPAWIMPLYRVFETVKPESEIYDVVIIDEASQTGPEGLVIQYLAKQCIVVGDDQQISPEIVGIQQDEINALINRHLEKIPFKDIYGPENSIFDHAKIRFTGKIQLREHFRCVPEIIEFSNQLCYSSTPLKPLRQYQLKRLEPIKVINVKDGYREGGSSSALNKPEADALIDYVVQICKQEEYTGKTMGIISLQGETQAKYIENKLMTRLNASDLEGRKLVCGDAYAFQGDDRDVILMSMVAATNQTIGALTKESDKRRFNVAASRAKDQVVLFHSANLGDLNPDCMRYKLLKYYQNPIQMKQSVDINLCQSTFEKKVYQDIVNRGYIVHPQYKVAGFRIDLVVEDSRNRLALECDGDEWHGIEQYEHDVTRQRILERCGWRFYRIRGYEYYHDPIGSLKPLWDLLDAMGIFPIRVDSSPNAVILPEQEIAEKATGESKHAPNLNDKNNENSSLAKTENFTEIKSSKGAVTDNKHENKSVEFKKGDYVRHPTFGEGVIGSVSLVMTDTLLIVDFKKVGRKKLILRYTSLELIGPNTSKPNKPNSIREIDNDQSQINTHVCSFCGAVFSSHKDLLSHNIRAGHNHPGKFIDES